MSSEILLTIACDDFFPSDEVLDASDRIAAEICRRKGLDGLDSGGGRESRDLWVPSDDFDADRLMISEVIGAVAPDALYTLKQLD